MDAGMIDLLLNMMTAEVWDGVTAMMPIGYLFLAFAAVGFLLSTVQVAFFDHPIAMIKSLVMWYVLVTLVGIFMVSWTWWTDILAQTAVAIALLPSGGSMSVDEFMAPGLLAAKGAAITAPVNLWLNEVGWWQATTMPFELTVISVLTAAVSVFWVCIALVTAAAIFMFQVFTLFGFLGLAFMLWAPIRWFGFNMLRMVVSGAMALFGLAVWTSIVLLMIPVLVAGVSTPPIDLYKITLLFGITFFIFCVSVGTPIAAGIGSFMGLGAAANKVASFLGGHPKAAPAKP